MKIGAYSTDLQTQEDPEGLSVLMQPGCYVRLAVPLDALAEQGYEVVYGCLIEQADDGHLRLFDMEGKWHDDCDVLVFQRWMAQDGDALCLQARATGQLIINDVDDYFWAFPKAHISYRGGVAQYNTEHYRKMLAASSAIVCSTGMLHGALSRLGPPVHLYRNHIRLADWPEPKDPGLSCRVGWIGGIPWRANDLPLLRGVLPTFLEQYGLAFFHGGYVKGKETAWDQLGIDLDKTEVLYHEVVPIFDLHQLWQQVDLAIVPLEDCTFSRAKSWLKGLEASVSGVPFIASRLPEYQALGVGRLAKTPGEWTRHLEELLDPEVRRSEARVNRLRAEELSIERNWPIWADILTEVTR